MNFISKTCAIAVCISLLVLVGCGKRPLKRLDQNQIKRTVRVTDEYAVSGKKRNVIAGVFEAGAAFYIGTGAALYGTVLSLPIGVLAAPFAVIAVGGFAIAGFLAHEAYFDLVEGREDIVDELEIIDETFINEDFVHEC